MAEEEENLQDYLERALTVSRRSVFYLDENLQELSAELFENLSELEELSDENIVQSVAKTLHARDGAARRIDALSLEVSPKQEEEDGGQGGGFERRVTFRQTVHISPAGNIVSRVEDVAADVMVRDILDEVISAAVEASRASPGPLYFHHPLAGREDVARMEDTFARTHGALTSQAARLKLAMKMILVSAAQQIVVSYRRILTEQAARLGAGEDAEVVSTETCRRCLEVTEQVAELAVVYLKNATRDVFDTSVNDVKIILGKMSEDSDNEIEAITKL